MWKKKAAQIELMWGMYVMLMIAVLLSVQVQLGLLRISSAFTEDALAASNLASAVIDIREYGKTHTIQIASPEEAYQLYCEAIRYNMHLNEQWENEGGILMAGPVTIQEYTVYNVKKEDVWIYTFGPEGNSDQMVRGGKGMIRTPDGTVVETTSVYSRVSYPVKGILGLEVSAVKQKTVDIVSNMTLEEEQ